MLNPAGHWPANECEVRSERRAECEYTLVSPAFGRPDLASELPLVPRVASTSILVRSSSFDFVVTKHFFFLNRNVNSFSIALFSFTMRVSDFFPPRLARLLADQFVKNQIVYNIIDNKIKLKS